MRIWGQAPGTKAPLAFQAGRVPCTREGALLVPAGISCLELLPGKLSTCTSHRSTRLPEALVLRIGGPLPARGSSFPGRRGPLRGSSRKAGDPLQLACWGEAGGGGTWGGSSEKEEAPGAAGLPTLSGPYEEDSCPRPL